MSRKSIVLLLVLFIIILISIIIIENTDQKTVNSAEKTLVSPPIFSSDSLQIFFAEKIINHKLEFVLINNKSGLINYRGHLEMPNDSVYCMKTIVLGKTVLQIVTTRQSIRFYRESGGDKWQNFAYDVDTLVTIPKFFLAPDGNVTFEN